MNELRREATDIYVYYLIFYIEFGRTELVQMEWLYWHLIRAFLKWYCLL